MGRLVLFLPVLAALLGHALSAGLWTRQVAVSGLYAPDQGLAWSAAIRPPLSPLLEFASDTTASPYGAAYALSDAQGGAWPGSCTA